MSGISGLSGELLTESPVYVQPRDDAALFDCGTLLKLQMRPNAARTRGRNITTRAIIVVLVGWMPLLFLAGFQSAVLHQEGLVSLFSDIGVSCRFLIAAPLLVLAEWTCLAQLGAIARHFRDSGLVEKTDTVQFGEAWTSTLRLRKSITADVVIIALAYAIVATLVPVFPLSALPAWHVSSIPGSASYSPAGWWHVMVSLPLLFILILLWLWRVLLWARFLFVMSRLDLKLVPAHPDRIAGLRFVGFSVQSFSLVGLALGFIAAGGAANQVLYRGAPLQSFSILVIVLTLTVVVVFAGPLLTLMYPLWRAWWRGIFEYGKLAGRLGQEFENKWLRQGQAIDEATLGVQDFSATTDLFQVVEPVYFLPPIPINVYSLAALVVATLLPFLGIVLLFTPVDVVVKELAGLLL